MAKRVLPEIEAAICDAYKTGSSRRAISRQFCMTYAGIHNIVRRNNLETKDLRGRVPDETEAMIVRDYSSGESSLMLAERYNCCYATIIKVVRRCGAKVRTSEEAAHRLPINHGAFDEITEASAYWAGFLMADGCVHRNKVRLNLADKDGDHVRRFREFLGSDHALCRLMGGRNPPNTSISVTSSRIVARLADFGVGPRKTFTAEAKILEHDRHFWRGVIDGDGSVCVRHGRPYLQLVGSRPLLQQFADYIRTICPDCLAVPRPMASIWAIRIGGKNAVPLTRELYRDCSLALSRKLAAAEEIMTSTSFLFRSPIPWTLDDLERMQARHGPKKGAWVRVASELGVSHAVLLNQIGCLRRSRADKMARKRINDQSFVLNPVSPGTK